MSSSVLQVSVSDGGLPKYSVETGIVTPLGLQGDRHAHPKIHGGPRKALLLITSEGIEELKQHGFSLYPGALGENITTVGLDRRSVRIGQCYRIGEISIQITTLRQPCASMNPFGARIQKAVYDAEVKAGNYKSPRWGLAGFYASVVQPGTIRPGDRVTLIEEAA